MTLRWHSAVDGATAPTQSPPLHCLFWTIEEPLSNAISVSRLGRAPQCNIRHRLQLNILGFFRRNHCASLCFTYSLLLRLSITSSPAEQPPNHPLAPFEPNKHTPPLLHPAKSTGLCFYGANLDDGLILFGLHLKCSQHGAHMAGLVVRRLGLPAWLGQIRRPTPIFKGRRRRQVTGTRSPEPDTT